MNKTSFIEKARKVHGDKYDYSKVEYVNTKTKVCIICPIHGEFWTTPNKHLSSKQGCAECAGNKKINTEMFIEKARKIHGDKYDYSKVEYLNNQTLVTIICKEHGEFQQRPKDHLKGQGCPTCGHLRTAASKRSNTEEFIKKFNKLTNNFYDTSKVEYINNHTKVCIICPKHGEFWATPNNLLDNRLCPKCGKEKAIEKLKGMTTEEFIEKLKQVHGDKYIYDKVEYKGYGKKVTLTCPKHGDFEAIASNLLKGHGCAKCAFERNSQKRIIPFNEMVERFRKVHGDKYEYDESTYTINHKRMRIICPIHGEFWQSPDRHLRSNGCPNCQESSIERTIRLFLIEKGIKYETQERLGRQRIDFYLPDFNVNIECQGEQHFKRKFQVRGKDIKYNFEENLERDIRKNKLIHEKGRTLLYFTEERLFNENILLNPIFNGIYTSENIFTDTEKLYEAINGR